MIVAWQVLGRMFRGGFDDDGENGAGRPVNDIDQIAAQSYIMDELFKQKKRSVTSCNAADWLVSLTSGIMNFFFGHISPFRAKNVNCAPEKVKG